MNTAILDSTRNFDSNNRLSFEYSFLGSRDILYCIQNKANATHQCFSCNSRSNPFTEKLDIQLPLMRWSTIVNMSSFCHLFCKLNPLFEIILGEAMNFVRVLPFICGENSPIDVRLTLVSIEIRRVLGGGFRLKDLRTALSVAVFSFKLLLFYLQQSQFYGILREVSPSLCGRWSVWAA